MTNTFLLVMMMPNEHSCLHEEQIMGQSRAIERLGAEMNYKRERLDDLKQDNRRMEKKIDDIGTNLNKIIQQSDSKDGALNERLVRIETRQDEQEKATKNNRDEANKKIALGGLILAALMLILTFFRGG